MIENMNLSMVSSSIRSIVEAEYIDGLMTYEQQRQANREARDAEYLAEEEAYQDDMARRSAEWYAQGQVFSDPGTFLFIGGPGSSSSFRKVFKASSLGEAQNIVRDFPFWFGCNLLELNEYQVTPIGFEWGPRTNFFLNAVEEYYQDLRCSEM